MKTRRRRFARAQQRHEALALLGREPAPPVVRVARGQLLDDVVGQVAHAHAHGRALEARGHRVDAVDVLEAPRAAARELLVRREQRAERVLVPQHDKGPPAVVPEDLRAEARPAAGQVRDALARDAVGVLARNLSAG